ncbi:MAG: hypothetical protein JKX85_02650 [Phycisphaeraceae bacterium]|nr:hypothetical protein [Phycisphaeraceae bacterium]
MNKQLKNKLETIFVVLFIASFIGLQLWSSMSDAFFMHLERKVTEQRVTGYQETLTRLSARRLPLPSLPENTFATDDPSTHMLSFQARLGVLAREAKLELDLMRAGQSNSFSPGTQTVPVTIRARGDLKGFVDFLNLLEAEQPSVFVDHIQLTPIGRERPDTNTVIQMHILRLIKSEAPT